MIHLTLMSPLELHTHTHTHRHTHTHTHTHTQVRQDNKANQTGTYGPRLSCLRSDVCAMCARLALTVVSSSPMRCCSSCRRASASTALSSADCQSRLATVHTHTQCETIQTPSQTEAATHRARLLVNFTVPAGSHGGHVPLALWNLPMRAYA